MLTDPVAIVRQAELPAHVIDSTQLLGSFENL